MKSMIISCLIRRTELAKFFHENFSNYNKNKSFSQESKCTNLVLQAKTNNIIKISAQLDDPNLAPKTYRLIVSRFLNKKKMPTVLPALVNSKLISDFQVKFEYFNSHFATQCTPV